jgi:hypothetical protein
MIDLSGWPIGVRLVLMFVPVVALLGGLAINWHIAMSRHYQVMCDSFSRSTALKEEQRTSGEFGLKSRFLIIAGMTTPLIWPSLFIRRGTLHPDDHDEFPGYLKFRMQLAMGLMVSGILLSIAVVNCFTW